MFTYSTFACKTGLLPCSTWANMASLVMEASTLSEDAQHLVLNGNV